MSQWLPLVPCVLLAVCQLLPSPAQLDDRRMLCLLPDMNVVVAQSDQHRDHTSPIDVILLSCDNCYAMIGQKQGGLLGVIQRALARASAHIWFERSEAADRAAVSNRSVLRFIPWPSNMILGSAIRSGTAASWDGHRFK